MKKIHPSTACKCKRLGISNLHSEAMTASFCRRWVLQKGRFWMRPWIPPFTGAESALQVGDNIGAMVRAEFVGEDGFEITTTGDDQITFTGDTSGFLSSAGINTFFMGTDAESIRVNQDLVDNVNLLAASADGAVGNNEAVLAMAALEDAPAINGQSPGELYRSIIAKLGLESSRVSQFYETNRAIQTELETIQEQNAGVSLDEESIDLIRYQQAFQASARIISTIDQLLDIVINQIGA